MKAKVKKFYSRISTFVVMFAMLCAGFIPAFGQMVIKAKSANTSDIVNVESIPTTGVKNTGIDIKKAKIKQVGLAAAYSDDIKITITDRSGNSVVCDPGTIELGHFAGSIAHVSADNKYVLTATEAGVYKVVYSYTPASGAKVFSREYKITITENKATFEEESGKTLTVVSGGDDWVANGSKINTIIPEEMNDSQAFTYYVPLMKVLDENESVISDAIVDVSIKDANGSTLTNVKELTVRRADGTQGKTYAFKPNAGVFGLYTIKYTHQVVGGSTIYEYKNFYVAQQSAFNPQTDLEFASTTFTKSFPDSLCLNTTVTLPTLDVTIVNKNTKEESKNNCVVSAYVFKQGNREVDMDGFSFDVDEVCDYYVQYTVTDAFGNTKNLELKTILKANVKDTQKPEVKVVENYVINASTDTLVGAEEDLKDATNLIPTKFYQAPSAFYVYYKNSEGKYTDANGVALSNEDQLDSTRWVKVNQQQYVASVELPAIYASDNATEKFGDFKNISRQISFGAQNYNLDALSNTDKDLADQKVIVKGLSTGLEAGTKINEKVVVYFAEAGEYTLTYSAKDKNNNDSEKLTFTITIAEAGEIDNTFPTVSVKGIPASVMQGSTIEFDAPKATDDSDGTRIQTYTSYFFGDVTVLATDSIVGISSDTDLRDYVNGTDVKFETLKALEESNKLVRATVVDGKISIPAGANSKLTVVSYAVDMYQANYAGSNATVGITVRETEIYAEAHDENAPVIASVVKPADYSYQLYSANQSEQGFYDAGASWSEDTAFDGEFVNVHKDNAVFLPSFKLTDSDTNLVAKAQIYRKNGEEMLFVEEFSLPTTKETSAGVTTYLTEKTSFIPTVGDVNYKVVVVAKDSFENVSFIAFDFAVKQWLEVDVDFDSDFQTEADFAEEVDIPNVRVFATNTAKKGKDITYLANVEIELVGNIDEFNDRTMKFVGTQNNHAYEFKYTINVPGEMKEPKVLSGKDYTVTVKDKTRPEISLIDSGFKTYEAGNKNTIISEALTETTPGSKTYQDIVFPYFTAIDDADIKNVSVKVTYGDKKQTIKHTVAENKKSISFNPSKADGFYDVTFTATDFNDLVTTNTYRLAVGDTDKPVIIIGDANKFGTKALNSTVDVNVTSAGITVFDAKSGLVNFGTASTPRNFDLVITAPSGKETKYSELSDNKFTFTESGTYKFTYTAKDEANNISTQVVDVEVLASEAETEDKKDNNIVAPIIIIAVSLLVLGFVVWYFLADHKKRGGKGKADKDEKQSKKSLKKDKTNNDNDKIVV